MQQEQNSPPVFQTVPKAAWLSRLEKDLRGRSLTELDWQLEENIRLAPFYTAEDQTEAYRPLTAGRASNRWSIGEYVDISDLAAANAQVLEGLKGGVNAPLFQLRHHPNLEALEVLLRDIRPDYISAHFAPQHPDRDPAELYRDLIYYVRRQGFNLARINGSVDFDPLLDWSDPPFEPLSRILQFAGRQMPHFRVVQVNGRTFHTGIENSSRELALIMAKGHEYLVQMQALGVEPRTTNAHLQFSVSISASYLVAIAKLRAMRILWANILSRYGLSEAPLPPILVHLAHETQTNDTHTNMIRAATQTLAAAVGGADTIFVLPADHARQQSSTAFTRRIARNVQHILQLEAHVDRVIDPAAGSYYLERLTDELAGEAWQQFQAIEAQGGFLELKEF